jgi:hypothetical protein
MNLSFLRAIAFLTAFVATVGLFSCSADVTSTPGPATADAGTDSGKPPPSDPDAAPVPVLDTVTPDRVAAGSAGPTVVVKGRAFVPRSVVLLGARELATTYKSATELQATVPRSALKNVGELEVKVSTPAPGGGVSEAVAFTVENPKPEILRLDPSSVAAGSAATKLIVTGKAFIAGSRIKFGADELPTTVTDSEHLEATLPATALAAFGSVKVSVVNPAPGGGVSKTLSFTVSDTSVKILSMTPTKAVVGQAPFDLFVTANGILPTSVIKLNGVALPTSPGGSLQIKAEVPASALTAAGDFPVVVENPPPAGASNAMTLTVVYAKPTVDALAPDAIEAGSGPTTLTVTGSGFAAGSVVSVGGVVQFSELVDSTKLTVTVAAAQLEEPGDVAVTIENPSFGGGGGVSDPKPLPRIAGTPVINAITPSHVMMRAPDTALQIDGAKFLRTSTATIGRLPLTVAYVSATRLTATIPAGYLAQPAALPVVVKTADAVSNAQTFTVETVKRVFVTKTRYQGDLKTAGGGADGLAGADNLCAQAAAAASLGGSGLWRAWLSTSDTNAKDRLADVSPWYLVDRTTVAFATAAQLATTPSVAIDTNETGGVSIVGSVQYVWTGTSVGGTAAASTCSGWTSTTGAGQYGSYKEKDADWTRYAIQPTHTCSTPGAIYCFEQ